MQTTKEIIIEQVKEAVYSIDNKAEIILYGSQARGDARNDSDWDFIVLSNEKFNYKIKQNIINKTVIIELNYNICLSLTFHTKSEWQYYDKLDFFLNIKEDAGILN